MKADILNKDWKYVSSSKTNIKATFARIRREQKLAEAKPPAPVAKRRIGGAK